MWQRGGFHLPTDKCWRLKSANVYSRAAARQRKLCAGTPVLDDKLWDKPGFVFRVARGRPVTVCLGNVRRPQTRPRFPAASGQPAKAHNPFLCLCSLSSSPLHRPDLQVWTLWGLLAQWLPVTSVQLVCWEVKTPSQPHLLPPLLCMGQMWKKKKEEREHPPTPPTLPPLCRVAGAEVHSSHSLHSSSKRDGNK